jgi:predicted DNA-binding protein (UPF0251 family)
VFSDRHGTARYTIPVGLAEVFEASANNPGVRLAPPDLERRLPEILDACRAAWPGLGVPEHTFVRHLAENLPGEGDLDRCLSRMHCPDLYLACGCAVQDSTALAAFDSRILSQAVSVLQRMGLSASQMDEVVQVVRTKLEHLKNRYQAEFKRAVEDAIATLGAEQRRALRLHYHDGLSIDRIHALLGVHRATAARWIRAAADAVRDETRRLLHARLGLSAAELEASPGSSRASST